MIAVEQLQKVGYKGFLSATARFDDQANELRKMGVHSVYNIYANTGAAYADYARNDCLSNPQFTEHFIAEKKPPSPLQSTGS